MAVEKMKLVNVFGPVPLIDDVISRLCINNDFHPENVSDVSRKTKGFFPFDTPNPYAGLLKKIYAILKRANIEPDFSSFQNDKITLDDLEKDISTVEDELISILDQHEKNSAEMTENHQIMLQIAPIINTDVTLDYLFNLEYIKFRFGRMPVDSYDLLCTQKFDESKYLYVVSSTDKSYVWLMYFVPRQHEEFVDSLFASLHFERTKINQRAHGTPKNAMAEIEEAQKDLEKRDKKLLEDLEVFINNNKERLLKLYSRLKYENDAFEIRRYAIHTNDSFYMAGWVPECKCADFEKVANTFGVVPCVFEDPDESLPTPPTKLKNLKIFKPFEEFVKLYGMPLYNEVDPTPLVAMTYTLIFGLMFGDIGQGLVLSLLGFGLWFYKKIPLAKIIGICGLFSMLGGVLYGSVFGYEEFLPGLKPLQNETHFYIALGGSIALGILLLLVSMGINIYNGIKQKDIVKALFSNNGLAGMIFYFAVIFAVIGAFLLNQNFMTVPYLLLFVVLPLIVMFFKEPLGSWVDKIKNKEKAQEEHASKVEFFIQSFFELFEVMLSYITNTISFVRIGAFALNHAGLMMFVFILARMSGSSDNIFVVVIGNLLVIGIEGLIVGIQVLRLQFYELFSHFYSGEGKPFEALTIQYKK
ncbi:MAG: V-type ATPase 116kDa subunit family protein [Bacillota bacterium]|nr:V-type ATPase 116kDa subunit family protein [Bacillota bacterium]